MSFLSEKPAPEANRSVIDYLREMGTGKALSYTLSMTKSDGTVVEKNEDIRSISSFNELLASLLWTEALQGDARSRKEVLDRLEVKAAPAEVPSGPLTPITGMKIIDGTDA